MSINTDPIFAGTITTMGIGLTPGHSTTVTDLGTAGSHGVEIEKLMGANNDESNDADIRVWTQLSGGSSILLGCVTLPAGCGFSPSVDNVDILSEIHGGDRILLAEGEKIQVSARAAVAASKTAYVRAQGGTYVKET